MNEAQEAQAPEAQAPQQIQLSLQDLATVVQFVDVASRRGAVAGNEMAIIGMLRNKIEMFLQQNAPQGAPDGNMPAADAPAPDVPEDAPLADKVVQ